MTDLLLTNEPLIRVAFFLSILLALAVWEVGAPRRRREIPRLIRWSNNFGLVVLDTLLVRLTFPIVAVGLALTAQALGWGLLNVLDVPGWLAVIASILALDQQLRLQPALVGSAARHLSAAAPRRA